MDLTALENIHLGGWDAYWNDTLMGHLATPDGIEFLPKREDLPIESEQSYGSIKTFIIGSGLGLKLTMLQVDLAALAIAQGWPAPTGSGTVTLEIKPPTNFQVPTGTLRVQGPGPDGKTWVMTGTARPVSPSSWKQSRKEPVKLTAEFELVWDSVNGRFGTLVETSSDSTAPTISSFSPVDGATGVAAGASVVITFSEAMNKESVEDLGNFALLDHTTGTPVTLTAASYNSSTHATTLTHSAFSAGQVVDVLVSKNCKDIFGNEMAQHGEISFTVAP